MRVCGSAEIMGEHIGKTKLISFVDGEMPADEAHVLLEHVAGCEICLREFEECEYLVSLLRSSPEYEIPDRLDERLDALVGEFVAAGGTAPARRPIWQVALRVGPVAAAVLAVVVTVAICWALLRPEGAAGVVPQVVQSDSGERVAASQRQAQDVAIAAAPMETPAQRALTTVQPRGAPDAPVVRAASGGSGRQAAGAGTAEAPSSPSVLPGAEPVLTKEMVVSRPTFLFTEGAPVVEHPLTGGRWTAARDEELDIGDVLRTGETARARLHLPDGAQVSSSFGTVISFLRNIEPAAGPGMQIALTEGEVGVWAPGDGRGVQISTDRAVVNLVRGEVLVTTQGGLGGKGGPRGTTVYSLAGLVSISVEGRSRTVPPGKAVLVTNDGQIERPRAVQLAEVVRSDVAQGIKHHELWLAPTLNFNDLLAKFVGPQATLGLHVAPVADADGGLRIYRVESDSPAGLADVQPDDQLVVLGGRSLRSATELMVWQVSQTRPGEVDLKLRRGTTELTIPVAFSLREPELAWPAYVVDLLAGATRAVAEDNLQRAQSCLRQAAARDATCAAAQFNLGLLHEYAGHWAEALDGYQNAAEYAPDSALVYLSCGRALTGLGNLRAAIEELQKALAVDPQLVEARYLLGYARLMRGDADGATAEAEGLLSRSAGKACGYFLLGQIAQLSGQFDAACGH